MYRGVVRIVAKCLAKLGDRDSQAVVEVANRVVGPRPFANLVAGNHFAGTLQQHQEHAQRLVLQSKHFAVLA